MNRFEVLEIKAIKAKTKAFKLKDNQKCYFDLFEEEIRLDGNLKKELNKLLTILEIHLNGFNLPQTKFKELKGRKKGDKVSDFEVKSDHLRLYFFKNSKGSIVVLGGKKVNQDSDIAKMRRIKVEYCKENP